jgi:hypothetical protein
MDQIDRRETLRGLSAYAYRPIFFGLISWLVAGLAAVVTLFTVAGPHPSAEYSSAISTCVEIWLPPLFVGLFAGVLANVRAKAELAAGYTTTPFGNEEVDLVDARTGAILRRAGEPLIDKRTFLALRREARLSAERPNAVQRDR